MGIGLEWNRYWYSGPIIKIRQNKNFKVVEILITHLRL